MGVNMKAMRACLIIGLFFAAAGVLVPQADGQQAKAPRPKVNMIAAVAAPHIDNARYYNPNGTYTGFVVVGHYFGDVQGSRRLLVNGVPIPHMGQWTSEQISGFGPPWDIDHPYKISIDDGTKVLSNVLTKYFLFQWWSGQPSHGLPGSEVALVGWGGGPDQGDKVIMLGDKVMPIVSWTQEPNSIKNTIRVKVPPFPPGAYKLTMLKNNVNATDVPAFYFSIY
jgi:hypothetical protein